MPPYLKGPLHPTEKILIALIALILIATFYKLAAPPVIDIDEAAYAENGREFIESGDWLTPTFRGVPAFHKPPFHLWNVGATQYIFGVNELAVRLVPAAYALGVLLLTFLLGARFYGRRAGLLATLILAASAGYYSLARHALTDMTLAFYIMLAFYAYLTTYAEERPRWWGFVLLYVAVAFGTLTKGPIGVGIPFCCFFLAHVWARDWRSFWRWHLFAGFLLWAVISVPWYVLMYKAHGLPFIESNLIFHYLQKYFESGHYESGFSDPFFLVHSFGWYFFPWSVFFLVALYRALVHPPTEKRELLSQRMLIVWFFFPFIVFSFSKFKLPTYLGPQLPAAALLAAWVLDPVLEKGAQLTRSIKVLLPLFSGLTVFAASLAVPLTFWLFFPPEATVIKHLSLLLPAAGIVILVLLIKFGEPLAYIVATSVSFAALFFFLGGYFQPHLTEYVPYKEIGTYLKQNLREGERPICYDTPSPGSLAYYSGAYSYWTDVPDEFDEFINYHRGLYILTDQPRYEELNKEYPGRFRLIMTKPYYHISRLHGKFLMEKTRMQSVTPLMLLRDLSDTNEAGRRIGYGITEEG
jgi:Dolichyl-phosphate-mannose-protein mannosyltransferase